LRRLIAVEPVSRSAIWSRRLAIFAVAIAAVAAGLSRAHAADPAATLTVLGAALIVAALAVLLALAGASAIWRDGLRGAGQATFGFVVAMGLIAYPAYLAAVAFVLPEIADVSTDLEQPPSFLLSAKARAARGGFEPQAPTEETRAQQRAAYPELATLTVEMDSTQAYQMALGVASDLGWRVVDSAPPNLAGDGAALIEAADKTLIFGFPADIAIRIRPGATLTAIDVRSVSRVGKHDFGANARRIRRFAAAVKEEARER
jgi:uncharacterized protein (DUF1499 family)